MVEQLGERGRSDGDDWPHDYPARDLARFASLVALSTAGGCLVASLWLWTTLSPQLLAAWLALGLAGAGTQWYSRRWLEGAGSQDHERRARLWIVVNALGAGLFWGVTTIVLFDSQATAQQPILAFVLVSVAALWLPLFTLAPVSLFLFTVPAVLPTAFDLLASPNSSQTTMGSLFLLLFAALVVAARSMQHVLAADVSTRRALYHQATHDPLVGLANRAEFHRRAQLLGTSCSEHAILCIDLDHFKEVNDSAGHAIGDELLCAIGTILRQSVRKGDTAARLGGDEFAVLMRDCGQQDALRLATMILERIASFTLTSRAGRHHVTASVGVACSAKSCTSSAQLLEAADRACYFAKRSGRNRLALANGADPATVDRVEPTSYAAIGHASI